MSEVTCCKAMQDAIKAGYFYTPIIQRVIGEEGKKYVSLEVSTPCIEGERVTPRSRKRKPTLVLSFCPLCGKPFDTSQFGEETPVRSFEKAMRDSGVSDEVISTVLFRLDYAGVRDE